MDGSSEAACTIARLWWCRRSVNLSPFLQLSALRLHVLSDAVSSLRVVPDTFFAADLDGDGHQDPLTLGQYFENTMTVSLGRAGGKFIPATASDSGAALAFSLADLNADGMPDAVLTSNNGGVTYTLGRHSAPNADLAVFLGLSTSAGAVRVENHGTE